MIIFIASDHAGFDAKSAVIQHLMQHHDVRDLGTHSNEKSDYPIYSKMLGESVMATEGSYGIGICGTGIGITIATNKIRGIRAALCLDANMSRLARKHNNANVLCLGARIMTIDTILETIDTFLVTDFYGDKHGIRVQMISDLEKID